MTLDQRGRKAADALGRRLETSPPSRSDLEARHGRVQRRRMRAGLVAFVVLVLLAVPVVLLSRSAEDEGGRANPGGAVLPTGTLTSGAWSSVPVPTSGLGDDATVRALASTVDGVVAVGSRQVDGSAVPTAWRSADGFSWEAASVPAAAGALTAVGVDGDTLLAVGASGRVGGPADLVWRSDDGGGSWRAVAGDVDRFGAPAPEMGRPFVARVVRLDDRWVAAGGGGDGTGETWVSDDGASWTATFPDDRTGGPDLALRSDGSLLAYWGDQAWTSPDGLEWSAHPPSLPADTGLQVVADGAAAAVGYATGSDADHTTPTPLLRSTDDGLTWGPDPSFLAAAPDATAWAVDGLGGVVVVGGSEAGSARPAAWASAGAGSWVGLPPVLTEGQAGGGIVLSAAVGPNVVLMGGGPVAVAPGGAAPPAPSRFFVLRTDRLAPP
jgi:hypothetical protein